MLLLEQQRPASRACGQSAHALRGTEPGFADRGLLFSYPHARTLALDWGGRYGTIAGRGGRTGVAHTRTTNLL